MQPCRLGGARGHGLERRFAALPTRPMPEPVVVHHVLRCRGELRHVQWGEAPACDFGRLGRGLLLHLGLRGLLLCPLLLRRRPRRGLSRLLLERLHAQQHGARLRRRLCQKILLARSLHRERRERLGRGFALARWRWRGDGHPLGAQRLRWQGIDKQLRRLRQHVLGRWRRVCWRCTCRRAGSRGGVAGPPQRRTARQVVGRGGCRWHAHCEQGIEMILGSDELTARDAAQVPPIVPDVIQQAMPASATTRREAERSWVVEAVDALKLIGVSGDGGHLIRDRCGACQAPSLSSPLRHGAEREVGRNSSLRCRVEVARNHQARVRRLERACIAHTFEGRLQLLDTLERRPRVALEVAVDDRDGR
mmetsp:Transcript_21447/g.70914  ORF Transcript_21447/g.70914 Transcript_21447/m.70914 type:complete len:363 (+) Transcript_21447:1144-2232(+)